MVTVGVLAAIVNVFVLFTVAIADRAIELIVRNFAASRLQRSRRAPVVHDSDTWLPNIPRSVVKYHRHPAILLTVLCTIFLITAELISEVGVDVSQKCTPETRRGVVISPGDTLGRYTTVELGASAFLLQSTTFLDGDLTRVPGGVPKTINGTECLPCLKEERKPDLIRNCRVERSRIFEPGELKVVIETTDGPFGTLAHSFYNDDINITGKGDLTGNGKHRAAFVFDQKENDDKTLTYLEYGDQDHLSELLNKSKEKFDSNEKGSVEGLTKAPVYSWKVLCSVNVFSFEHFMKAVMVYRTIQLETPTRRVSFNTTTNQFTPLSADDIYRAALSAKIIDDDNVEGDYYVYTTCGIYKWQYIIPIVICVVIILTLGLISVALAPAAHIAGIPYNSRSWFRHSQKTKARDVEVEQGNPSRSGYFESIFEEMVLVSDGPGANPQIVFRARTRSGNREGANGEEPVTGIAHRAYSETFEEPFDEPSNETYQGTFHEPFT